MNHKLQKIMCGQFARNCHMHDHTFHSFNYCHCKNFYNAHTNGYVTIYVRKTW